MIDQGLTNALRPNPSPNLEMPSRFRQWLRSLGLFAARGRDRSGLQDDHDRRHPKLTYATDQEIAKYATSRGWHEDRRYTIWELATLRW